MSNLTHENQDVRNKFINFKGVYGKNMDAIIIPDWKQRRIIIAEDEESNFLLIKAILKKTGIQIHRALNGKEVLELLEQVDEVDLVLMDIKMPVMDGLESTRRIRAMWDIPVIAQTAYATEIEEFEFRKAGFDDYLTKPLKAPRLLSTMQRYLQTVEP